MLVINQAGGRESRLKRCSTGLNGYKSLTNALKAYWYVSRNILHDNGEIKYCDECGRFHIVKADKTP